MFELDRQLLRVARIENVFNHPYLLEDVMSEKA
jgi:hypothetical protein